MPLAAPSYEDLSVAVVSDPGSDLDLLAREVQRTRASVTRIWPMPQQLPDDYDVLICDYGASLINALPWSPGEANSALVVILPTGEHYDVRLLCDCSPDAVLHRPLTANAIATALVLARNQFLYFRRLQMRIARLDETLRATRDIERAKQILMKARDLSEAEAYEWMRRNAMNRRQTIAAVATAIVDSHMVLG
jgi:AmiR/NasT family two-component response regulator